MIFRAAWGSAELWISRCQTDEGRDLVIQKYTRGNVASVQNRGDVVKIAHVTLLFDEMIGQKESGEERLNTLILLKEQGKPQLFTHPIHGTYLAEIGEFSHSIDDSGTITGEATFVAVEEVGAVIVDPIGVSLDSGTASLSTHADQLDAELAAVEIPSTISALARAAGDVFDQATSARDSLVQLSDVSARINQEIDDLQLSADIALWPAMKAFVMLSDATRSAADAATGDSGGLMTIRIDAPTSLRRLCAEVYGGNDADAGYQDAMQLNDIRTPARIPTGTMLRLRQSRALQQAA